jgi:glycosyltransferase involved in cell wall biosynthesis
MPLVSVIIPCFNAGPMLEPSLRSAFAQSYPNLEVIFVDNNSTDGSGDRAQAIATRCNRPVRYLRCTRQGGNHARMLGYAEARGDFIQWLDADDALGLEKIEHQVRALQSRPDAMIAYCDWMMSRHQPDGTPIHQAVRLPPMEDQILRTLCGFWYPTHAYLLRRPAAEALAAELAWFPERRLGQDVEYIAIAAMLGMRFLHVPEARVQHNAWSPTQISGAATPYPARAAALRDIWTRLRQLADRPDVAPRIGPQHRFLLDEDWAIWRKPQEAIQLRLAPRQRAIATALEAVNQSLALPHHAMLLATQMPALGNDVPFIVATLRRFRDEGMLIADRQPPGQRGINAATS